MPMTLSASMTDTMRVDGFGCSLDLGAETWAGAADSEFVATTGLLTAETGKAAGAGETWLGAGATDEICAVVAEMTSDLAGSVLASEATGAGVGLL